MKPWFPDFGATPCSGGDEATGTEGSADQSREKAEPDPSSNLAAPGAGRTPVGANGEGLHGSPRRTGAACNLVAQ
jgi:hypothetical protein